MKRIIAAIAVLTASLVLAPTALAHPNVTGSASQACNEDGTVTLTASFSNEGFETQVTATDSQAGDLGTQTAPATFTTTVPGPDRAAGSVSFAWTADDGDSGTVVAPYDAVSGCVGPPPLPPPNPPPPSHHMSVPPGHHSVGGPPSTGHSPPRKGSRPPAAKGPPAGVSSGSTLPFSGLPLGVMALGGLGLLLGGTLLVGLLAQQRYNEARRRRRPH